jgi:hypothetical protein
LQHLKFSGTESNCFKMFRIVLFPIHNRIMFQLHTTKTELQQRTMGPMLLELKLLKYIFSTTEYKQDLIDDPVLCSACPLLMVDDLQRGVVRTLMQSGRPGGRMWRAGEAARQNVEPTTRGQLSGKTCARKHRCQLNHVSVGIAPCLGMHCWRAIFS